MNFNDAINTAAKTGESAYIFEKVRTWTQKAGVISLSIEIINANQSDLGVQSEAIVRMSPDQARILVGALLKTIEEAGK